MSASGEAAEGEASHRRPGDASGSRASPPPLPWPQSGTSTAPGQPGASPATVTSAASSNFSFLGPGRSPTPPGNIESRFDEDFSQHIQKRNRQQRMQLGAVGAVTGGAIGVMASPVLLPGLAFAAIVGGAGGYQWAKRWGKEELKKQAHHRIGDKSDSSAEGSPHGPPLRRLRYLVKWGHWQLLEYEESPPQWRTVVLDEVLRAFSPWVQRMYLLRAKGPVGEADPEAWEAFQHLAPLYYFLQRRAAVEGLTQSVAAVSEAIAQRSIDEVCEERCRVSYPTVLETISVLDRLSNTAHAQLQWDISAQPTPSTLFSGAQQKSQRRHRLQRLVVIIREVLEHPELEQALAERRRLQHKPEEGDGSSPQARGVLTPSRGRRRQPSAASSEEDEDIQQLVVPPEGVENEMEGGGVDDVEEYFSVSGESEDEAAEKVGCLSPKRRTATRAISGDFLAEDGVRSAPHSTRAEGLPRGEGSHTWNVFDASKFDVRGGSYLRDRQKVPSGPAMLDLVDVDFINLGSNGPIWRATEHFDFYAARHLKSGDGRFLFVQNWVFPPFQVIITAAVNPAAAWLRDPLSAQARVWRKFLEADNDGRRDLIKIILAVDNGPWLVRRAVPRKPVLIGKKLKTSTYHDPGKYLEIVFDVASSRPEQFATATVIGALRKIQLHLAMTIEAREEEELPENLLIALRGVYWDPSKLWAVMRDP